MGLIAPPERPVAKTLSLQEKQTVTTFLDAVSALPEAAIFLYPVDAVQLPDYYTKIKNPIDISQMRVKLHTDVYATLGDFESDFKLMMSNCKRYNTEKSSWGYKWGIIVEKFFKREWKSSGGVTSAVPSKRGWFQSNFSENVAWKEYLQANLGYTSRSPAFACVPSSSPKNSTTLPYSHPNTDGLFNY